MEQKRTVGGYVEDRLRRESPDGARRWVGALQNSHGNGDAERMRLMLLILDVMDERCPQQSL